MSTEPLDTTPDSLRDAPPDVQDPPAAEIPPVDPPKPGDELDEDGKPKKVGGFQKRISKLTSANAELKAENERLRAGTVPAEARQEPATPPSKPEPPNEDDFNTRAEFRKAELKFFEDLADWKVTEREKARESATEKAKAQEKATETQTAWMTRLDAAQEAHPDLEDLLEDTDLPATPAMVQTLLESDLGAELLYHLAKNPDECRRIAALSPLATAREIGRIEASLVSSQKSEKVAPKKVTSAPAPLAPLKGAGTSTQDESKQSDAEWLRSQRGRR